MGNNSKQEAMEHPRRPAQSQSQQPGRESKMTPLIPATVPPDEVATFESDSPLGRAGEPWECAECFVSLASADSRYMTGQVLHPNGGEIING